MLAMVASNFPFRAVNGHRSAPMGFLLTFDLQLV
jgi:hypothetical protein